MGFRKELKKAAKKAVQRVGLFRKSRQDVEQEPREETRTDIRNSLEIFAPSEWPVDTASSAVRTRSIEDLKSYQSLPRRSRLPVRVAHARGPQSPSLKITPEYNSAKILAQTTSNSIQYSRDPLFQHARLYQRCSSSVEVLEAVNEEDEADDQLSTCDTIANADREYEDKHNVQIACNDNIEELEELKQRIASLQATQQGLERAVAAFQQLEIDGYQYVADLRDAMLSRDAERGAREQQLVAHAAGATAEIARLTNAIAELEAENQDLEAQVSDVAKRLIERNEELVQTMAERDQALAIAELAASSQGSASESSSSHSNTSYVSEDDEDMQDAAASILERLNRVLPEWQKNNEENASLKAQASSLERQLTELKANEQAENEAACGT